MTQTYEPKKLEARIYKMWDEGGYFKPSFGSEKPTFCIMIPPPNVTGSLHLGHALDHTIQDVLVRWHRMKGFNTLWQSGTDHAGIATQSVVERHLEKKDLNRKTLGREKFVKEVWKWKTKYENRIISQMKKLGDSCDWSRNRFTMDDGLSKAVKKVFVNLYNEGLIYRGKRLINWDPKLSSALSDLEVEHQEKDGHLWHVKYPFSDSDKFLVVATTRPETILGDTAIAVHPEDERYKKYIGKTVILEFLNKEIKVISDEFVDQSFGSGVVKITPAHDFKDYEVGLRHKLDFINILNPDGTLNNNAGKYEGLKVLEARKMILKDLKKHNLLVKKEKYKVTTPISQRTGEAVEPYLSDQWFVSTKSIAPPAEKVVQDGTISFEPEHWAKTYLHWMSNIQDWCISRQLWWGHRIPAWHCNECKAITVSESTPSKCCKCKSVDIYQDNDVLDTWFSSALWPFSTLGWPEQTKDLTTFYPTNVLVTGHDIIFFWVARMIMSGLHHVKGIPFRTVFVHGIIRDEKGEKMSKSLGNTLDPLDLIDKSGADALRITLMSQVYGGNDIKFSEKRLEGYRNFLNKIFNATKFCLSFHKNIKHKFRKEDMSIYDKWIIQKLSVAYHDMDGYLSDFKFAEAVLTIYSFVWNDFCDRYLERIKPILYKGEEKNKATTLNVLTNVLDRICRLSHPIIPFLTEDIYQKLPIKNKACIIDSYPNHHNDSDFLSMYDPNKPEDINDADNIMDIITYVRQIKGEIFQEGKLTLSIRTESQDDEGEEYFNHLIESHKDDIEQSSGSNISVANKSDIGPPNIPFTEKQIREKETNMYLDIKDKTYRIFKIIELQKTSIKFCIPLQVYMLNLEEITKKVKKIKKEIESLENRLKNKAFREKAPPKVVEKDEKQLKTLKIELATKRWPEED